MTEQFLCGTVGCITILVGLCFSITLILCYSAFYLWYMKYLYKKHLDLGVSDEEILHEKSQRRTRKVDTHPIFKNK